MLTITRSIRERGDLIRDHTAAIHGADLYLLILIFFYYNHVKPRFLLKETLLLGPRVLLGVIPRCLNKNNK